MRSSDVDSHDWMDAFDSWRKSLVKSLLVHFLVQPPAGFSSSGERHSASVRHACECVCMHVGGVAVDVHGWGALKYMKPALCFAFCVL